ncbi:excinuclease ABC subunit UvrC [Aquisalimonas sp. 2447]|uniref:excinuclease ABC subunit UvrC n=1 Tax=Aquisalimonas sp. 2447 TaxID=2740807 RepID=UPI0014326E82|nr:excinuclease ABC subunit UvrC [Aquisalimonas sp. 2447]QIT55485.1 excinuclease ABC subunit UvrC [Aquisalimonas sp. 2447]
MSETSFDAQALVRSLPEQPGVYRMLDSDGQVIYVGKARKLRRRVASYFNASVKNPRTRALVAQVADINFTVTHTEAEALILENNLIKEYSPRYNVLLRDDKSYPYIYLSAQQQFPRLGFHRGARRTPGRYFGPFPSAGAVRETLSHLQKVFPVRQCEDTFFANRSRPCLQYQIKRCTAPCVGYISPEEYARDVEHAVMFLEGKSGEVIDRLVAQMEQASEALDFEAAARLRDRIATLRRIQEKQAITGEKGDLDVVAGLTEAGVTCIQVFVIRNGQNLGNKSFFPRAPDATDTGDVLAAFMARYYLGRDTPKEILVNMDVPERDVLEAALGQDAGHVVHIRHRVRSDRRRWVEMAVNNARTALQSRAAQNAGQGRRMEALQQALDLEAMPDRLECFDISHTGGEATVASCVVFDAEGAVKSDYRRFNIADIEPGDDYAAMRQALERRYLRLKRGEGILPDLLIIDGGQGQVRQAMEVLEELQVDGVTVLGISKGPDRRPGEEKLYLPERDETVILPPDSAALHLLQQIRDEAHRFAITGHRTRRGKARQRSQLDDVPGLGPKRRQNILKQFGGLRAVSRAGVDDLARVPGVSRELAQRVYDTFHGDAKD